MILAFLCLKQKQFFFKGIVIENANNVGEKMPLDS
jgi:hypothetical protein